MDIKVQREVDEVTKGIIIYAIIISAISIFIPKETIHIIFIVAVVIFVSVKNPNINVIGTVLGLISTQIVIFIKKLLISKIQRKEVK